MRVGPVSILLFCLLPSPLQPLRSAQPDVDNELPWQPTRVGMRRSISP